MEDPIRRNLTVKQVVEKHTQAIPVFIELKTLCIGCHMEKFCTLEDVAIAYKMPFDFLFEKLLASIQTPIEE